MSLLYVRCCVDGLYLFRYLYALYVSLDANFKLKRKNREMHDVPFADGFAYFVEGAKYAEHLARHDEEIAEVSCSFRLIGNLSLRGLDKAL